MGHPLRQSGALGSCLAIAICILGCTPTWAHANGDFWVESEVVSALETPAQLQSESDGAFTLAIPSKSVTCSTGKLSGGRLLLNGKSSGSLVFESCNVECSFSASFTTGLTESAGGVAETLTGTGTIIASGTKCPLLKALKINGSFVLIDSSGTLDKLATTHLLTVASESKGNEFKLTGSLNLKLAGTHAGQAWRGSLVEPKGDFKINGLNLTSSTEVEWEAVEELRFAIPEFEIEVGCNVFSADESLLLTGGKFSATLLFEECTFFLSSEASKFCSIADFAAPVNGLLILSSGRAIGAPTSTESPFTTWEVSGALCPLGELSFELSGSVAFRDGEEKLEVSAEQHLLEVVPAATLPCYSLKWGENVVELKGGSILRLAGEEAGEPWSGITL